MIFSGHTTLVVLVAKVFGEYCRGERLRGLRAFPERLAAPVRGAVAAIAAVAVAVILSTRLHYTLDVLLAVYLTHYVFEAYHTWARLLVLREGSWVIRWLEADEVRGLELMVYAGGGLGAAELLARPGKMARHSSDLM